MSTTVSHDEPTPTSRGLFDVWAKIYDAPVAQRLIYRPVQDLAVRHLGDPEVIVDLGCGTGLLTRRLAHERPEARVIGCDVSHGMLAQAGSQPSAAVWAQGDAQAIPLHDRSADAVVCTESFHWYPDQHAALAEIRRVLRPGGRFLVAFVNPRLATVGRVANTLVGVAGQRVRWMTRRELAVLLERAGFDVLAQITVPRIGAVVAPTVLTVATRR